MILAIGINFEADTCMSKIIKELTGHSGSKVYIMKDDNKTFVKKIGNTSRNIERIQALKNIGLDFPKIYSFDDDSYEMEYIQNIDMKTFLSNNGIDEVVDYIKNVLNTLRRTETTKDYGEVYQSKLKTIKFEEYKLKFSSDELISRLPKVLPQTEYHGDFTLENILFNIRTNRFVLIDPITTEYDSYIFDIAKLKQDLICEWFIRNDNLNLKTKLNAIDFRLTNEYKYVTNEVIILMLLRILPYSKSDNDVKFLVERIHELWK